MGFTDQIRSTCERWMTAVRAAGAKVLDLIKNIEPLRILGDLLKLMLKTPSENSASKILLDGTVGITFVFGIFTALDGALTVEMMTAYGMIIIGFAITEMINYVLTRILPSYNGQNSSKYNGTATI